MKRILKGAGNIAVKKLCMTFVFFAMLFVVQLFESIPGGAMIYSTFICILLFYWIFKDISAMGRKHIARSQSPLLGLYMGAVAEIPSLLMALIMFAFKGSFPFLKPVFLFYNMAFSGFFKPGGGIFLLNSPVIAFLIPVLSVPLLSAIFYYIGYKHFDVTAKVTNKIIFKEDEEA